MIVTTTQSIEGKRITEYKGIVTANAVFGTNVIKENFASLTDFFGGRSNTYQKDIKKMLDVVRAELIEEAVKKDADAIVGFSIDFGEISGHDLQMLMVTTTGTAVSFDVRERTDVVVRQREIDLERLRLDFIKNYKEGAIPKDTWEVILAKPMPEKIQEIVDHYINKSPYDELTKKYIGRYLHSLDSDVVCDYLYSKIGDEAYRDIINVEEEISKS